MNIWNTFASFTTFLTTELSPIIDKTKGAATEAAGAVAGATGEAVQQAGGGLMGGQSMLTLVLIYGGMIFALWFFLMRPQRKREKQMAEMRSSLKVGENVVTSSGFYGKIVSVGQEAFVIEFGGDSGGRSIRIPVNKADIVGVKDPVLTPPPVAIEDTKEKKKK